MRAGYVLEVFPKLSESFILNEIVELLNLGVDIQIFSIFPSSERIYHDEVRRCGIFGRANYFVKKGRMRLLKSLLFYGLRSWKQILYVEPPLAKIAHMVYAGNFAECARKYNLDLVHAHFASGPPAAVGMHLSRILKVPFGVTAHAADLYAGVYTSERYMKLFYLKELLKKANYVITPSFYNKDYLNRVGISSDKIKVVRACANINKYRRIPEINRQRNLILTACRLVGKKGLNFLIMALKKLIHKYPELTLKIVGTGMKEPELRALVSHLSLEKHVHFLGNISDTALLKLYNKAWMYVLPCVIASDGDRDICPVTLLEAMACQTPVISTNVASIPELIEDGHEGIIVDQGNVEQLRDAIDTFLTADEGKLERLGEAARRKVEREFDPSENAKLLLRIFNSAVKR